ncbi:MAG: glycoside hydrolase [Bacteroidetes bacterium]|nr:glycoside hydrolase [Bacteroidota bacterium]MDF2452459.1 glycoside hydrolase [Bacteroidota bacterium]
MKLLILTQYFPPEVGAPQNRLFELAVRLKKSGVDVSVLTAMPNYPQMKIYDGYQDKDYLYEEIEGIPVHRASIYLPKSKSIVERLKNYFSFVYSSARVGNSKVGEVDAILCESPPLFLGYSALYLKRKKKAKLIFNVSDLWPESAEKLGVVTNRWMLKLAYNLEAKLYRKSVLVTGQTQGICKNINQRFPDIKTYWLPNGVDVSYYDPSMVTGDWRKENGFNEGDVLFLYAGIIGLAQGLEIILSAAGKLKDHSSIKFILLGSGPEKEKLQSIKQEKQLTNVYFFDAVSKTEMPSIVQASDVSIIPLRKLELFLGAIPSKIFENLSMEKPVILAVDGEARELFVNQGKCALYSEPENVEELVKHVLLLANDPALRKQLGERGREYVEQSFNRNTIAQNFYKELIKHVGKN